MRRPSRFVTTATLALISLASGCNEIPVEPPLQTTSSSTALQGALATVSRIDLGTLGGAVSYAMDINDAGIVVGWSDDASGANRAFRWTSARGMVDLGTLPGDQWSRAISVTSRGRILGVSGRSGDPLGTPVTWSPSGAITPLPIPQLPGAPVMVPTDRNALGQVIGGTNLGMFPSHAWMWSHARGLQDIGADMPAEVFESGANKINEWGVVVGTYKARVCINPRIGECWHAFLWRSPSRFRDLGIPAGSDLGSAAVTGSALNDLGVVVGWTIPGPGTGLQPYRWAERTGFTLLPTFAYEFVPYGYATSLNLISTVVGASHDAQFDAIQAAAWPRAGGIVKLNAGDPNSSVAVAVNIFGVVVGWTSLDCCGFVTHATLWKLGPGRGILPPTPTTLSQAPELVAARVRSEAARSGPAGCLSDPHAIGSKQLLVDCLVKRRN